MNPLTDKFVRTEEFRPYVSMTNPVTGELVKGDFEIHRDDEKWMLDLWQDTFLIMWKIDCAVHDWHVQRSPGCLMTHTMSCLLSGNLLLPPMSTWP